MRAKIYDAMPQQPAEPLDFEVDLDDVQGQAERLQNGDTYPARVAGARASERDWAHDSFAQRAMSRLHCSFGSYSDPQISTQHPQDRTNAKRTNEE